MAKKVAKVASRQRQVIHHHSVPKTKTLAQRRGKAHFHFCSDRDCRLIYEDACQDVGTNGPCQLHRGVRRPVWVQARDPQECCIDNCELVAGDDLVLYRLAGPGPWFQCKTCRRAHGWTCSTLAQP